VVSNRGMARFVVAWDINLEGVRRCRMIREWGSL
jgi:hypothetical protein